MSGRRSFFFAAAPLALALACHGPKVGEPLSQRGDGGALPVGAGAAGVRAGAAASGGSSTAGGGATTLPGSPGGTAGDAGTGRGGAGTGGASETGGSAATCDGPVSHPTCGSGLNGRATRTVAQCSDGSFEELEPCTDPDVCRDDALRGTCPAVDVCIEGAWNTTRKPCDACSIVRCDDLYSGVDCCAGWHAFMLVGPEYVHDQQLVTGLALSPGTVSVTFNFSQLGQIGIVSLDLPSERATTYDVRVSYEATGDVFAEISFDLGEAGIAVPLTVDGIPVPEAELCFPDMSRCVRRHDRINVRVRPGTTPGPATLTVSGIEYR